MAEVESVLLSLIEKEIPEGRKALRDGYENLAKVATYCEQKYLEINSRYKGHQALDETRAIFDETKQFSTQALASVAYQINSLAGNMMSLLDQQGMQLQRMESRINHIAQTVTIHKEKVARREIGVLATSKATGRTHRIIAPSEQEKAQRYTRKPIDFTSLDDIGHGVKVTAVDHPPRRRQSSKSRIASPPADSGTIGGKLANPRRPPLTTKPPPPPVPPPMPPSIPPGMTIQEPPSYPVSSPSQAPPAPVVPMPAAPPPPPPPGIPGLPGALPPNMGRDVVPPAPPSPPPPPMPMANLPPPDIIPSEPVGRGSGASDTLEDMGSPLPPPPEDAYQSPSSLMMPAPPQEDLEDMYQSPSVVAVAMPPPPPVIVDNNIPVSYIEKVVALYDYDATREDELTFSEGKTIYVIRKNDDGWFEGVMDGKTGLFPGNYVEMQL